MGWLNTIRAYVRAATKILPNDAANYPVQMDRTKNFDKFNSVTEFLLNEHPLELLSTV